MIEAFRAAFLTDGLYWLAFAALVAGLVRGFSGFGTAMIYLPVAGAFLSPVWALTSLLAMDLIAPLSILRKVAKDAYLPDLARLAAGCALCVPIGVALLVLLDPDVFRYIVSAVALILLTLLASGVRYRGKLTPPLVYGTGGIGGLLGGLVGIPGPPVILLYMASTLPPSAIRANNYIYLLLADLFLAGVLAWREILDPVAIFIGVLLAVPYLVGIALGSLVFQPDKERTYRFVAYCIIATSAILGLPFIH